MSKFPQVSAFIHFMEPFNFVRISVVNACFKIASLSGALNFLKGIMLTALNLLNLESLNSSGTFHRHDYFLSSVIQN